MNSWHPQGNDFLHICDQIQTGGWRNFKFLVKEGVLITLKYLLFAS